MSHVMCDIESLSLESDAVIIAIGAVKFDPVSGTVFDNPQQNGTFYQNINAKSAHRAGGSIDCATVMWWMTQSEQARTALTQDPLPIEVVLKNFSAWVRDSSCTGFWGNGAGFDNVVIGNAYKRLGLTAPWSYKVDRCYRTISGLNHGVDFEREGTYHNALDDAISQAKHLCKIAKKLNLSL